MSMVSDLLLVQNWHIDAFNESCTSHHFNPFNTVKLKPEMLNVQDHLSVATDFLWARHY